MARPSNAESHHKDGWKKETLLLTCVLRLRVLPAVPYTDIANILLKTISKHLSGVVENTINLAKLSFATATNTTSANATSINKTWANTTSANSISANSTWAKSAGGDDENRQREMWMKQWLAQYLKEDFLGAEFRGDHAWWRARNMDAWFVSEMLRAGGLDGKHVVASEEEMKLQILWRRTGDWRAGSVPDGWNVQESWGTIGDQRI